MSRISAWIGLAAALLAACSLPDSPWFGRIPTPDPTHFRWCNNGEPEYIDPALASSTTDLRILYQLFDGLTTHDPQGLPEPSLATSWDVSPDQRRFVFHLRHDARWSNGRALTADDFVYSLARVLHPMTASQRAEVAWKLRNAEQYTGGTAKLVLHDAPPFSAGDVVEVLPGDGGAAPPDSNARRARTALGLRLEARADAPAHTRVPAGDDVTIVELSAARDWAWVYWGVGDGAYGWVPLADLDEPNADRVYRVRRLPPALAEQVSADRPAGTEGTLPGRELLMLPEVLGVRAPDPYTVVFETSGPTPYFVDLTLQNAFRPTPREAVARWPRQWTRPAHIVTSGPFDLTEWHERDKFELRKSTTFWGRESIRLERVTIFSMNDIAASSAYYYQGGCDATVANNIPASWFPVLAGETGNKIRRRDYYRAPFLGVYVYLLNVDKLNNVHLRRALSHALDRSMMPVIMKGGQIPTEQYTPGTPNAQLGGAELALCGVTRDTPGVSMIVVKDQVCYVPPFGPRFDVEAARRELAIARQEMGASFPQTITIRFNSGVEYHKHIAEWAQHEWQSKLGLDVRLESQEWKMFLKDTREKNYQVARFGWIGNFPDPEGEFLRIFKCKTPDNRTGFCDPEFERLFALAENEPDRKTRMALVRQAEQIMIDQAPIIPLWVYTQHHLQKPYVRGLDINFVDQQSLRRVWIDPDWRAHLPPEGGTP